MGVRRVLAGVAATVLVAGLAACGGGGGTPEKTTGGAQELTGRGPITWAIGKDSTGTYQDIIAAWNAKHPDEKVSLAEQPSDADATRNQLVQNAEIESTEYDVLGLDVTWATEFAAKRYVVELPKSQFDASPYLPSTVKTGSYRGRLYAAPLFTGAGFLYHRTDLLKRAGITDPPKTWAEMRSACAKVLKLPAAKGVSCYTGQHKQYEGLTVNFSEAVYGAGGEVVGSDGKPRLDTPEAKEGLNFLVDGFESTMIPKVALTYDEEIGRAAYQKGKFLFQRNWPYLWEPLNDKEQSVVAGKFDVAPLPGKDGPGTSMLGGTDLAISSFSEHKRSALDFITYLTSTEVQKTFATKGALPPTRTALYTDDDLKQKLPYLEQLKVAVDHAQPRPQVINYAGVSAAISDAAYAAEDGSKTPDQALGDLQQELTKLTKNQP
ncbi:MAG: extracellular solute-binding protein [Streptosporangiales bacterium]|nr:extracellular solute-binding protein [Streptosporangiales bacterium]